MLVISNGLNTVISIERKMDPSVNETIDPAKKALQEERKQRKYSLFSLFIVDLLRS